MAENKEEKPVKSEKQKMLDEELYYSGVPELKEALLNSKEMCYDYNNLRPKELDKKKEILKKLLKKVGEECYIESPFYCDYGFNTTLGENFYANHNLVILDVCEVTFGDNVFIGPNVGIYTAGHPLCSDNFLKPPAMKYFRLLLAVLALIACTTTADAQSLRDKSGNSIGKIESDGIVRNKSGNRIGQITSSGEIRSSSGNTIGKIDNSGNVRDKSGNTIGKIESDGTVRDKSGNRMGKVESDGTIRNASGNTIGKAQGVDRRRAGAYFFFNFL